MYCKLIKTQMKTHQKPAKFQLQFQARGQLQLQVQLQVQLQLQFEYTASRTGNFGANCWGGAVHREVTVPHRGYTTSMDILL